MSEIDLALVYRQAAAVIEHKGWVRGHALGLNGERCVSSAILQAAVSVGLPIGDNRQPELFDYLARWLVKHRRPDMERVLNQGAYYKSNGTYPLMLSGEFGVSLRSARRIVTMWNDEFMPPPATRVAAARTKEEVVSTLYAAAASFESTGPDGVR